MTQDPTTRFSGTAQRLLAGLLLFLPGAARAGDAARVDFNRQVRPILSESCYQCHGPDQNKRKADLRLDIRGGLFRSKDGTSVVVPGKLDDSELFFRITTDDPDLRMPPPKSGGPLKREQIALIGRWIEEGAQWKGHWAYLSAAPKPPVPPASQSEGDEGQIDRFIRARLKDERLLPSPPADRPSLIRRLSFDLTGLPPTPEEVDAFTSDLSSGAYERLADRLLASPRFGERMAIFWLDLVRYADTTGYHGDNHVDIYLFRDYVIRAFNENMPFDRFTIEQVAGDQLAQATTETRIASGYNRLLQTTQEGGAQAKEYMAKYSADRVRNLSTVWLGTTLGCAECHDHKYDPFTTREFYSLAAFFADVKETAVGVQEPTYFPSPRQAQLLKQLEDERAHWKAIAKPSAVERGKLAELDRKLGALKNEIPSSLVSAAATPRVMRVLPRGNWQSESGPVVVPGVPGSLPRMDAKTNPATRLDLARWLVSPGNPLPARVMVNRLWKLYFGQGLVTTLDDFGSQGARPTHPELLDWLACEFTDSGWNVKKLIKLLIMSRAYRQSSSGSDDARTRDPGNRWLARQGRFRLDAEVVRDNVLAVSGLVFEKIGGPSVKPYQPPGYWVFLNFPKRTYEPDKGENQYRRGLYTYWQRTFLHPSLLAFDASTREECVVERPRSNTPLQALVLLNDPNYVEAARAFAVRLIREAGTDPRARLEHAFRLALSRSPRPQELPVLLNLLRQHLDQFRAAPAAAREAVSTGASPVPPDIEPAELAAWMSVARVILNLHETITRS